MLRLLLLRLWTVLWLVLSFLGFTLFVALRRLLRGRRHASWSYRGELGASFMRFAMQRFGRGGLSGLVGRARGQRVPVPRWIDRRCEREALTIDVPADAGFGPARSLTAQWFVPRDRPPRCTLLYLHGGGYVFGSIATHSDLIARLALRCPARVLALAYRLAPEFPFPAALDDVRAAYRWLQARDDAQPIVFGGDSAGGGLALAALLGLRASHEPLPAAALLFSPWVDLSAQGGSFAENARFDFLDGDTSLFGEIVQAYAGEAGPRDTLVSPGLAELHGLPPLLLQMGGAEVFRDQVRALAERAQKAGVTVQVDELAGMVHVAQALPFFFPEQARAALRRAAAFLDRHLPAPPSGELR